MANAGRSRRCAPAAYLELERQLPRPLQEYEAVLDALALNEAMAAVVAREGQAKG